jgi:hypothetical protein
MTYHVDVIETDWSAGIERLAARLILHGEGVEVTDSPDPVAWTRKLLVPIPDGFGGIVEPDEDAKLFLFAFVDRHSAGSFLYALGPHDRSGCPFGDQSERKMQVGAAAPAAPERGMDPLNLLPTDAMRPRSIR